MKHTEIDRYWANESNIDRERFDDINFSTSIMHCPICGRIMDLVEREIKNECEIYSIHDRHAVTEYALAAWRCVECRLKITVERDRDHPDRTPW